MNWEQTATGYRCTRHDTAFARGEVCTACTTDPGVAMSDEELDDADDRDLTIREGEVRSLARFLFRHGRQLVEDGTPKDKTDGVKLVAEGTKLERLALEIRDRRMGKREVSDLLKKYRELLGVDGSH